MAYLDKKDHIGYATIAAYAICTYFSIQLITNNFLIVALCTSLVTMLSISISKKIYLKKPYLRLIVTTIPLILLVTFSYVQSIKVKTFDIVGIWLTDNEDNLTIKMRIISQDSVFLSMSPDYKEIGYKMVNNQNILILQNRDIEKFMWDFKRVGDNQFVLSSNNENLIFHKQK